MKTAITLFTLALLWGCSLHSQIIHVPQDHSTIQGAIDAAVNNDTVLVAQGEYFENINFLGKNIVVCSNFAFSNDFNDVVTTIINGSTPVYADTGSCVLIVSGEDSTAVLQGFTLTGGTGTRWEDEHGANHWYTEGGGILIQYSSPTIRDNIITWNEAINKPAGTTSAGGGGIRCGDGNPSILNNVISYNKGRYGGGIVMNYSGAQIKNNIIIGNSGGEDFGGGGMWFLDNGDEPLILENNTIVNNSSALSGGGIRVWFSDAIITNNIIWGNTANSSSQIQGFSAQVNYCCVEGGFSGEGNIEDEPAFVPESFILSDISPCIDAGNAGTAYNDPEDPSNPGFALFPSKGSMHSDMGVYGGPGCKSLPDVITGIFKPSETPPIVKMNIFPNPASSTITLEASTDIENTFEIQLCDSNSVIRRLGIIHLENNGQQEVVTDISDLSPGIYFITLRSDNGVQVYKIIKI